MEERPVAVIGAPVVAVGAARCEPGDQAGGAAIRRFGVDRFLRRAVQLGGRQQRAIVVDDVFLAVVQEFAVVRLQESPGIFGGLQIGRAIELAALGGAGRHGQRGDRKPAAVSEADVEESAFVSAAGALVGRLLAHAEPARHGADHPARGGVLVVGISVDGLVERAPGVLHPDEEIGTIGELVREPDLDLPEIRVFPGLQNLQRLADGERRQRHLLRVEVAGEIEMREMNAVVAARVVPAAVDVHRLAVRPLKREIAVGLIVDTRLPLSLEVEQHVRDGEPLDDVLLDFERE